MRAAILETDLLVRLSARFCSHDMLNLGLESAKIEVQWPSSIAG
jgi:hypothetical protein